MARKQSPQQRLISMAMAFTEEQLTSAIDTLKAVKDARFAVRTPAKPRAKRSDAEKKRGAASSPATQGDDAEGANGRA